MVLASFDIGNSLQQGFNTFFGYIPNILGFLVILIVGYFVAKIAKGVVNKVLDKLKVDQALERTPAGGFVDKISPGGKPSHLIGGTVFWLIFLFVLTAAIGALKIPAVTAFMNQVLAYLPNVIAAVLIFVVAAVVAGVVVAAVQRTMGDTPTGKLVETVVPGLIMAVAVFMILSQLHIAQDIVRITYTALIGMLALAGALAFGLGGRDVAAQMWSAAYDKSSQAKQQAQQDAQTGTARAQSQASQLSDTATYPETPRYTGGSTATTGGTGTTGGSSPYRPS